MLDKIDDYIGQHTSAEPELLHRLYRHTNIHHLYGRMCSGKIQGRLLKMLTSMIKPHRVLEIGTFTGYSALCIAEALAHDARLHTIEIDDEQENNLRYWFGQSPHGSKIELHIGDALNIIPTLNQQWDMVLIDANKRLYTTYLELVLPKMKSGGYILADNTLWNGKVLETPVPDDAQTKAITSFNELVATDSRFETVMLPLRDGLTVIRVKEPVQEP